MEGGGEGGVEGVRGSASASVSSTRAPESSRDFRASPREGETSTGSAVSSAAVSSYAAAVRKGQPEGRGVGGGGKGGSGAAGGAARVQQQLQEPQQQQQQQPPVGVSRKTSTPPEEMSSKEKTKEGGKKGMQGTPGAATAPSGAVGSSNEQGVGSGSARPSVGPRGGEQHFCAILKNLPVQCTDEELRELLRPHVVVTALRNNTATMNRTFAFVNFDDPISRISEIQATGLVLRGKRVDIEKAVDKFAPGASGGFRGGGGGFRGFGGAPRRGGGMGRGGTWGGSRGGQGERGVEGTAGSSEIQEKSGKEGSE